MTKTLSIVSYHKIQIKTAIQYQDKVIFYQNRIMFKNDRCVHVIKTHMSNN